MEIMSPSSLSSHHHDAASTCEEVSLQEGLLFSDSLKDLRNLRSQLYSAAEYFEVFYRNNAQKPTVMTSLKEYTLEALVSTVDHLGFVSYKANDLVNEKVDEVNETEFRVSSVEQRVRTCQQMIDQEGRSQQSLVIKAPNYHKHYILPGKTVVESVIHPVAAELPQYNRPTVHRKTHKPQTAISPPVSRQPTLRRMHSTSPAPSDNQRLTSLSPSWKARAASPSPQIVNSTVKEKRAGSPIPNSNPLGRSTSVARRPTAPNSKHPRHTSMQLHSDWNNQKDLDRSSNKSRGFLKSLLTRRRWRNDESLYNYLDEY